MTGFADVPKLNAIYQQVEQVQQAIASLDDGGAIMGINVQAPIPPGQTMSQSFGPSPAPMGPAMGGMPVMLQNLPLPAPDDVKAAVRGWLVSCQTDLNQQLSALGIGDGPPPKAPPAKPPPSKAA